MAVLVPPKEPVANLLYRKQLRTWATESEANRKFILEKCQEDFFFWLNSFAWLYEPRAKGGRALELPFLEWPHQHDAFKMMLEHFGERDIGLEKGRAEGATYMCINLFVYRWLFHFKQSLGVVSLNELSADNPQNPGSLGARIDWCIKKMPLWMVGPKGTKEKGGVWDRNISKHTWQRWDNAVTGAESNITAYPCTADMASGDRRTAFFMDELAKFPRGDDQKACVALNAVTDCRIFVSTYRGADGAFYSLMNTPSSLLKLRLHWLDNPSKNNDTFLIDVKNRRLLDPVDKTPILLDTYAKDFFEEYLPLLDRRGFPIENREKVWSPWYVSQCLRPQMTPKAIAEELDADPAGTGSRFFDVSLIERLILAAKEPEFQGDVEYVLDTLKPTRIVKSTGGPLRLWLRDWKPKHWRPVFSEYVVACDIASGLGTSQSSNSAITILDRATGVKVGEYASTTTMPERLAEIAIALAKLFHNAFLIWEANGNGGPFNDRVMISEYRNIYWRTPLKSSRRKATKVPGFWTDKNSKRDLLSRYRWALQEGFFQNPSAAALAETKQYTEGAGGKLEFIPVEADELDPADIGDNHGDRCIADALANFAMEWQGGGAASPIARKQEKRILEMPQGSFGARQERARRERRKKRNDKYWG